MKIKKEKMKKIVKLILVNLISLIIMICVLYNIVFSIITTISGKDYLEFFGISLFNIENDLMQDELNKNDLVIVKQVKESELHKGDIIAYTLNGQTRINKIINQNDGYITKYNKNYQPDIEAIQYNNIIGKVTKSLPLWRYINKFFSIKSYDFYDIVVRCFIFLV